MVLSRPRVSGGGLGNVYRRHHLISRDLLVATRTKFPKKIRIIGTSWVYFRQEKMLTKLRLYLNICGRRKGLREECRHLRDHDSMLEALVLMVSSRRRFLRDRRCLSALWTGWRGWRRGTSPPWQWLLARCTPASWSLAPRAHCSALPPREPGRWTW